MADSFEFELTEDVEAAVARATESATRAGTTFHGDRFAGMFRGKGIEGYYRVDGSKVVVTVTARPPVIPMSMIETGIRSYFGVEAAAPAAGEQAAAPVDDAPSVMPRAKEMVRTHALYASGAGLVPIPVADLAAVTAVQVNMLLELTGLYGRQYSRNALREFATALTGGAAARIGASALKAIPGIGTLLGGATMSITSGATTYAVGMVTIEELEQGREIGSTTSDRLRRAYKEAFEEGKELIRTLTGSGSDRQP